MSGEDDADDDDDDDNDDDDDDDDGNDDDQLLHTEQGWQAHCEYLWQSRYRDPEEK